MFKCTIYTTCHIRFIPSNRSTNVISYHDVVYHEQNVCPSIRLSNAVNCHKTKETYASHSYAI